MKNKLSILAFFVVSAQLAVEAAAAAGRGLRGPDSEGRELVAASTIPDTVGWNPDTLVRVRALLAGGSLPDWAQAAKDKLAGDAASRVALPAGLREGVGAGPWSVVGQGPVPPAPGTSRDYSTVSGYYWPCHATCPADQFGTDACSKGWVDHAGHCDAETGSPWIKHDGFLRDENLEDLYAMIVMMDTAEVLTLAWWFLPEHDASYSRAAVTALRSWFWDESTGMEPRLLYGAAIPGVYNGTAGALIAPAFRLGTRLSDCVEILKTSPDEIWTPSDDTGWEKWSRSWSEWMKESEFGVNELGALGNHATFLFSHKLAMARAVGDDGVILDVVASLRTGLPGSLEEQILPSGEMPIETARQTGKTYSLMNLNGLFLLGEAVENACRGIACSPEWDWSWKVTDTRSSDWETYHNKISRCRWKFTASFPESVDACKASCLAAAECNAVVAREKYGNLVECSFQLCSGTLYGHETQEPSVNVFTSFHYVEGPEVGSGSLRRALDFMLSYATGGKSWEEDFPESIDGSGSWRTMAVPLRIAAGRYNDTSYESEISEVDKSGWFLNYTFNSLLFPPSDVTPTPGGQPSAQNVTVSPWAIDFVGVDANFSLSSQDELSLNYEIGKDRLYESYLYQKDCASNITDVTINSTDIKTDKNVTHDRLTLKHSIDKAAIANSSISNGRSDQLQVCQIVHLIIPANDSLTKMVIVEDIRVVDIDFDLSVDYSVVNELGAGTTKTAAGATNVSSYVEACKCEGVNNFTCDTAALVPNTQLHVCVKSVSTAVEIRQLVSMVVSQGLANMTVVGGGTVAISSIAEMTYVNSKNGVVVTTFVPTNIFTYAAGASINISGAIDMELGGSGGRLLGTTFDADHLNAGGNSKALYELRVNLQDELIAIEEEDTWMGSSASVVPNKASLLLSMAFLSFSGLW